MWKIHPNIGQSKPERNCERADERVTIVCYRAKSRFCPPPRSSPLSLAPVILARPLPPAYTYNFSSLLTLFFSGPTRGITFAPTGSESLYKILTTLSLTTSEILSGLDWPIIRPDLQYTVCSACNLLLLIYCLAYSWTIKMEIIYFSEMLGSPQATQHYNTKDHTLHRCLVFCNELSDFFK